MFPLSQGADLPMRGGTEKLPAVHGFVMENGGEGTIKLKNGGKKRAEIRDNV